jgi:hypothetical protein
MAPFRSEIVQTGIRAHTAAGTFTSRETTVLEPDEVEFKLYAPPPVSCRTTR